MTVRRRPAWKLLLAAGAVFFLLSLLWVWKLHLDANRILERGCEEGRRLERGFLTDPQRPPLLGEGEAGDAWDVYAEAAAAFRQVIEDKKYYDSNDPAEPGFDPLRRGARRRAVSFREERPEFPALRSLLTVVNGRAASLHRAGRDRDALERIRLVLAVVRDLELHGRHPREIADVEMDAHDMTFFVLEAHALEAADLREHAAFLDRLEERRPDLLPAIRFALDRGPELRKPPGWRHFFSDMLQQAAWAQDADGAYTVAKSFVAPVEGRLQAIEGRIASGRAGTVEEIFMIDAARRMYARLARIGVELAAHEREQGRFPDSLPPGLLRCPYGGRPLVYRPAEGLVYSQGFDGVDDGGKVIVPDWAHWPHLRYQAKGDLVVRVARKR